MKKIIGLKAVAALTLTVAIAMKTASADILDAQGEALINSVYTTGHDVAAQAQAILRQAQQAQQAQRAQQIWQVQPGMGMGGQGFVNVPKDHATVVFEIFNQATDNIRKFFDQWNEGNRSCAIRNLSDTIELLENDDAYGRRASVRLRVLKGKAERRKLPFRFADKDFDGATAGNLICFLEAPIVACHSAYCDRRTARHQAIMGMLDNEIQRSNRSSQMYFEQHVKGEIDETYRKKTGDVFDPDDRPTLSSGKREAWDRAKTIYDIFKN